VLPNERIQTAVGLNIAVYDDDASAHSPRVGRYGEVCFFTRLAQEIVGGVFHRFTDAGGIALRKGEFSEPVREASDARRARSGIFRLSGSSASRWAARWKAACIISCFVPSSCF
jgi:hypothetical protein